MHLQSSLVLSLTAASTLALETPAGYAAPSTSPYTNSTSDSVYVQYLHSQVSSLKAQLASKLATAPVCDVSSSVYAAVSRESSAGTASATYPAAYETVVTPASISRLVPTTVYSYGSGNETSSQPGSGAASGSAPLTTSGASGLSSSSSSSATSSSSALSGVSSSVAASNSSSSVGTVSAGSSTVSAAISSSVSTNSTAISSSSVSSSTVVSSTASSSTASPSTASSSTVSSSTISSSTISSSTVSSSTASSSTVSSSSSTSSGVAATYVPQLSDYTAEQVASGEAWKNLTDLAVSRMQTRQANGSCTYENARVRTEFRSMSNAERKSFTDAVTCLAQTAPRYTTAGSATYPGVQARYDEYVATHINKTYTIHGTADFFAWHRNFIYEYEQDLVNVCGYTGNLPYWDWARDAEAVDQSELFNGDEFSMGGNGEYIAGREDTWLATQDVTFPPGTGGGCVTSGPFSNGTFETNLGPLDSPYGDNVANQYDYNPRCLVRDLNSWFSSRYNTYTNVTDLVLGETDIQYFQSSMQGFLGDNKFGVHGGGHWLGGGPSQLMDFHSSPSDPVFYLHHAMVDRIWTVWQYLDLATRQNAIYGTSTLLNSPATPDMSLTDVLDFGLVGGTQVFGDLMDTLGDRFCYRYD